MAQRFLSNIRVNDAYTLPASDGSNGQVIVTDGSGNLTFADPSTSSSASVIYRDNFTGDGSTVAFTLQNSLSDEDQTFIYIDGVYQEKGTYSLSTNTITFTTAPDTGHSIEVISISGINVGPTTIYQDNFTGDGTTTDFTLAQVVDNEVKTMIYFNGVYQFKGTYSLNGTALSFDTAPANGVAIEVISIASAAAADYNQKVLFYGKASEAISKGDAIMLGGQQGDHFLLSKATQTAIAANHEYFLGLASQDLAIGEFGYVTEFGRITEIDTSGYTAGDILWFDAGGSTAGALTTTEPAAPLAKIQVAAVIRSHANEGVLFIRPTWYHELGELHDVNLTSVTDKDILAWNNTQGYWENTKTLDSLTANTLSATTLTGTLSTAAQTNITSVGTLSSLDVSGNATSNKIYLTEDANCIFTKPDGVNYARFLYSGLSQNVVFTGGTSANSGSWGINNYEDTVRILNVLNDGYVGIGTVDPVRKLVISNGGANGIELDPNISGNSEIISYNRSTNSYTPLYFEASAYYLGSGNVGIGNTNPTSYSGYKILHIGNDSAGGIGLIKFGTSTSVNGPEIFTSTNNDIVFNTDGSATRMTIIGSNGSVGINTTSPETLLEVQQSSVGNDGVTFDAEGINRATIQFQVNTDYTRIQTYGRGTSLGSLSLNPLGNNVGIGTTSPSKKLSVEGGDIKLNDNNAAANYYLWLNKKAGQDGGILLQTDNALDWQIVNTNPNGDLLFYTYGGGGIPAITFKNSNGNVGIGTTSPDAKLEINGDTSIRGTAKLYFGQSTTNLGSWTTRTYANGSEHRYNAASHLFNNEGYSQNYTGLTITNDLSFGGGFLRVQQGGTTAGLFGTSGAIQGDATNELGIFSESGKNINFYTNGSGTKKMVLQSDGILVHNAGVAGLGGWTRNVVLRSQYPVQVFHSLYNDKRGGIGFDGGGAGGAGIWVFWTNRADDNVSAGTPVLYVSTSGVENYNGTYGTISDERVKENIVDASPKLNDILSLKVKNYNLIGDETKQIGFVAQEFEKVFPSLVTTKDTRNFDEDNNLVSGFEDTKSLKVGMEFAILVKAIQEQQAIIEDLKARIETLENN